MKFNEVIAIAEGGSAAAGTSDKKSDIDIYVFVTKDIPVPKREEIIKQYSSRYEAGGMYFGSGDEFWIDSADIQLDVMYWNFEWFKNTIENVWENFIPSNGYSTAFLYTLSNCRILYDKNNVLMELKEKLKSPYPAELKQNIIKRNIMLLKDKPFASYFEQISKAVERDDIVSINHRVAAFLASYFDIIFAVNEMLHPGEKRLISYALNNCKILPEKFAQNIQKLLTCEKTEILQILTEMTENLKKILRQIY